MDNKKKKVAGGSQCAERLLNGVEEAADLPGPLVPWEEGGKVHGEGVPPVQGGELVPPPGHHLAGGGITTNRNYL